MIKGVTPITSADFNKGLVTRSDFLKGDINASPNTMDVQWNFDASLHKRFGCSSTNSISIGSTGVVGWAIDNGGTLSTGIRAYWKMDEASGIRYDQVAGNSNNLYVANSSYGVFNGVNVYGITGIRNGAASFIEADTKALYMSTSNLCSIARQTASNMTIAAWVYIANTNNSGSGVGVILNKGTVGESNVEYLLRYEGFPSTPRFYFYIGSSGRISGAAGYYVRSDSFGNIALNTWYNVLVWRASNAHLGISVNLNIDSTAVAAECYYGTGSGAFAVGAEVNSGNNVIETSNGPPLSGRVDEVGVWGKVLVAQERADLYSSGSGDTFLGSAQSGWGWASFDFGASAIRWLTIAAGTAIYASSNRGTTFLTVATSRTQSYQSFTRSKNVLIATSDQYDVPLYWAGSAGTFTATLAPGSAPAVKFAINFNGFLILLNSQLRKRGFFYEDENLQLTQPWTTGFDLPSSDDDEITAPFILNKYLYVSTRYRMFRVAFQGGNPDWIFAQVKDWGYVPRTVQLVSIQGGGQVAVGLDWNRRLRMFDGVDDQFMSDNVENDNQICDFAMDKVSYAGSGLQICHATLDPLMQEYRLNVAIGPSSTQTTHGILFNARSLAMYPYSNQGWQTMCVAESNNQQALMAVDRSGFVYILNSGNLDGTVPINEVYDSPPLFSKLPEVVSKGHQLNMFFAVKSSGTVYHQDRVNLSNQWSPIVPLSNAAGETVMTGTENVIKILRTVNTPSVYNTYQFRLTSSSGTAVPWELDRIDYIQQGFGIGKG